MSMEEYMIHHKDDMNMICDGCSYAGTVDNHPYCGYHELHMTWILPRLISRMECNDHHESMTG